MQEELAYMLIVKKYFPHIIIRYNDQSGNLGTATDINTLNYYYSYRNFHFLENKLIADGFTF